MRSGLENQISTWIMFLIIYLMINQVKTRISHSTLIHLTHSKLGAHYEIMVPYDKVPVSYDKVPVPYHMILVSNYI